MKQTTKNIKIKFSKNKYIHIDQEINKRKKISNI